MSLTIYKELPPPAYDGEKVAMDTEIFGMDERKLHRPHGTFACMSVCLERDPDTVYQFNDPCDLPQMGQRLNAGKWVFQNALFDLRQMRRFMVVKPRRIWDTMLVEQGLFGGY